MLYRCWWDIPPAPSPADAENESDEHAHDLIGQQKENGGDGYHDEDHRRGDGSFAPRRPRDLLRLDADLLQELEWTDLCHVADLPPCRAGATYCALDLLAEPDYAWQEWRDSNPQPPVLETGALAIELHSSGSACGGPKRPAARCKCMNRRTIARR